MRVCCVEGPAISTIRTDYYNDMAVFLGATRLGQGGKALAELELSDVGLADSVAINKYKTTFYDGRGDDDDKITRVDQIKAQRDEADNAYDKQILTERIGLLVNGVAKICVGGYTEMEIKEKYDRIEDALNSARSAIDEGVLLGGGVTLLREAQRLEDEGSTHGDKILAKALKVPFRQLLANAGVHEANAEVLEQTLLKQPDWVYDIARSEFNKAGVKSGIIDSAKSVRCALQNAVSIAGLLTTSGGAIVFEDSR